tara:strand:+ start:1494 stop:2924 length:1431 start_codon:yes stop_codon:yes gene_type:complete
MFLNKKKTFWNQTLIYGVGFVLLRAISFLLLPLYTNLLSTAEAGWVFILYTILAFFNTIFSHGMDSSLLKFYNKGNQKQILTTSILYSVFYSLLISFILFIFYQFIVIRFFPTIGVNNQQIIGPILFILIADMLASRIITLIRLLNNPYYYLFISFVNIITSIVLNIYFIHTLRLGLVGVLYALMGVSFLQLLLLLPTLYQNFKFSLFNKDLLKKMICFSMPFLPASVFFIIIEMSDRWMLGWLSTIENVGLYGAGYKIGSLMLLIVRSFNLNWQPFYLNKDLQKPQKKFSSIGTNFILFLIFLCTILSICWPAIFNMNIGPYYIIGQQFGDGGFIIPIIGLSYIFYGIFILQMPPIYRLDKQNWVPVFWGIGAITNFCANLYLIPLYGIYGAAYGTLLAYVFMTFALLYKNYDWMFIKYNIFKLAIAIIISIIFYYLSTLVLTNMSLLLINIVYIILGIAYFTILLKRPYLKIIK